MNVVGIDPGLDGGIAYIVDGTILAYPTPTIDGPKGKGRDFDRAGMVRLLRDTAVDPIDLAIIERVTAAPVHGRVQGSSSMFNFGKGYGLWLGMLVTLAIPHQEITPQAWKKAILAGTKQDKQAAILHCQTRFPTASLLATPRSRVPHDGMADALCLAELALRTLTGGATATRRLSRLEVAKQALVRKRRNHVAIRDEMD